MTDNQADRLLILRYVLPDRVLDGTEEGGVLIVSGGGFRVEIAADGTLGEPAGINGSILATQMNMAHSQVQEERQAEAAAEEAARPVTLTLPPELQRATGVTALTVDGPGLMPRAIPAGAPPVPSPAPVEEEGGLPPTHDIVDPTPPPTVDEETRPTPEVLEAPSTPPAEPNATEPETGEEAKAPAPPKRARKTAKSGG